MWYILVTYFKRAVTGFISTAKTKELAVKECLEFASDNIVYFKNKKKSLSINDSYLPICENNIKRWINIENALMNPINSCKFHKISGTYHTDHWMMGIKEQHICNKHDKLENFD